ncbi:hypothetical protein D3C71_2054550 [compost metagenome]
MSISACTRVVMGFSTVLPVGAVSRPLKALFVSRSVPPVATSGPCTLAGSVKPPAPSVVADHSPASSLWLPLASANTVAPFT